MRSQRLTAIMAKIETLTDAEVLAGVEAIGCKPWLLRSEEERAVYGCLCDAWGARHGEDAEEVLLSRYDEISPIPTTAEIAAHRATEPRA